jgi:phosphopantothenate---cysteine ligase (ATP)
MHRTFSLEPYTRHYTHSRNCFLDMLECVDGKPDSAANLVVTPEYNDKMMAIHREYHRVTSTDKGQEGELDAQD